MDRDEVMAYAVAQYADVPVTQERINEGAAGLPSFQWRNRDVVEGQLHRITPDRDMIRLNTRPQSSAWRL